MRGSTQRVLPTRWTLTAHELERICGRPVNPTLVNASRGGSPNLIDDVEGLLRGILKDAQDRRILPLDLSAGEWHEVFGFLLGEVVTRGRKYDPARSGIEFRPWLYAQLRAYSCEDAKRWLYGRKGQHRVSDARYLDAARHDAGLEDDGSGVSDDAAAGHQLDEASLEDPADRLDARRWLDATADRREDEDAGVEGGGARGRAQVGDRRAGARAGGRAAGGDRLAAHWLDCLTCGWRNFPQAPNGVDRWHFQTCAGCGADLGEQAA